MQQAAVQLKFVGSHTILPEYKTPGSAGADLIADVPTLTELLVGEARLIQTGVAIWINNPDLVGIIASRSGHGGIQVRLANSIGVIDEDYQGEIGLIVENNGRQPFTIVPGMRLAQLLIMPKVRAEFEVVPEFITNTVRGTGGFGSTGTKSAIGYEGNPECL